jgi:hypothetical protein
MNLFSSSLDRLQFADIESFLGLKLPEDQRLKEGERIDYKELMPQNLGDWVTAFANGSGGLIFIGIKSDKTRQNIPVSWSGIPATADIETQIAAKILSTVRPKPDFQIGSVQLPGGNIIAIVRVHEGSYPPYEYDQGSATKITLRVHDARRSASVREIEALLKKRTEGAPSPEIALSQHWNATGFDCLNANGVQDLEFHRIAVVPRRRVRIRLDSSLEKQLEFKIPKYFNQEPSISFSSRRGDYLQLQSKVTSQFSWHHLWRIYESGALGFTGTLMGDFPGGKPIGDLALDLLLLCRLASEFFETFNIEGDVYVTQLLKAGSAVFLPKFPILPGHDYFPSDAIYIPTDKQGPADRSVYYQTVHSSLLAEPYQAIAEILMYNLRETRQVRIDYERFLSQIAKLKPFTE